MTTTPLGARQGPAGEAAVTSREGFDLDDLRSIVEVEVALPDYPLADAVADRALVYRTEELRGGLRDLDQAAAVRNELTRALHDGPGVIVITGAIEPAVVDRATEVFEQLIADEREAGTGGGDHYAEPGANDRLWNALEKLAVADPEVFVEYHGSDMIDLASLAWLGPGYQITAQVNAINPGGAAQMPHRDYHVGFMTDDVAERYPIHAHRLSSLLTLQGGIAHCYMPPETGATMLLPHSHKYELGYLAWRRPEFIEYFAQHRVQLPLRPGDAVFFSPAMFHAAGHNRTADVHRMANLLQISSAVGRATEAVDRARMVHAVYPRLRARLASGLDRAAAANVVACCAEGYAFPTNLDRDQPVDGLAPPSQADLMNQGLDEDWTPERLRLELYLHGERHRSSVGEDPPLFGADEDGGPAIAESAPREPALVGGSLGQAARLTVDELLAQARSGLRRFAPGELATEMESATAPGPDGPLVIIDIRDRDDRERTGMIPGSVSIPLIVLEWRCHPTASYSHPAVESFDQPLVMVCNEGYTSSLAAASLRRLGFSDVSDLEGGIEAWSEAGLPVTTPPSPA